MIEKIYQPLETAFDHISKLTISRIVKKKKNSVPFFLMFRHVANQGLLCFKATSASFR